MSTGANSLMRLGLRLGPRGRTARQNAQNAPSRRSQGGGLSYYEQLCKLARSVVDPKKSLLCGRIPSNVRKRKKLQMHATWDGVVAWSQSPDNGDDALGARREDAQPHALRQLPH